MPAPLEGIRVLDVSHAYAGPFCSLLLASLGGFSRSDIEALREEHVI